MNIFKQRQENIKRLEDKLFDMGVVEIKLEQTGHAILHFAFPIEGLDGMRIDLRQGKSKAYQQAIDRLKKFKQEEK